MNKLLGLLLVLAVSSANAEKIRYDNYKVFTVYIVNESNLQVLQDFQNEQGVIFWEAPEFVGTKVNVAVSPEQQEKFQEIIENGNLKYKFLIENMQAEIDKENPKRSGKADFDWTSYHEVDEIYAWIDEIAARFPNQVTVTDIGNTFEGRKMKVVKISFQPGNRGILIESNIHAREWIASATTTFLINELLTSTDPDVMDIARKVDWYIIPLANPDGLQYSHDTDRLWRSTRSTDHSVICHGADSNRNFAYKWMTGGASRVKCSYTYGGPAALSEVETRNTDNFMKENASKMDVFLAFHSYGLLILAPYGNGEKPATFDHHMEIGNESAAWIERKYGRVYTVGNSLEALYATSGSSVDHAVGQYGIPIAYTYEMRDNASGFLLPAEQIIPNAEEIVEGMKGLVLKARELGYLKVPV